MVEALRLAGAPEEVIAQCGQALQVEEEVFEVWPENESTLEAFLYLSTSWTVLVTGLSRPVFFGISSSEIAATLDLLCFPPKKRKRAFRDLRDMEQAALEILNEK